ncbi:MAG: alpha/beta fold hydrolase, partial [Bacteroidota bacterium]
MDKSENSTPKNRGRKILILLICLFTGVNIIAWMHAYTFTHFSETDRAKSQIEGLGWQEKLTILLTGIKHPRPETLQKPAFPYIQSHIHSGPDTLEVWESRVDTAKGTVLFFHGFSAEKSSQLERAAYFRGLGYSVCLVDFRGSGGSSAAYTTIGFHEADDVLAAFEAIKPTSPQPVYLFGTSMGAAAILRAMWLKKLPVQG